MEQVNGDMEDLFRRAAAKYPLRTDSADWDRLAADLDKDPGPPPDTDDKRRRRGIFWWWLLLPLVGGLGFYAWRATVRPSTPLSKAVAGAQSRETVAGETQGAGTTAAGAEAGRTSSGGATVGGVNGGAQAGGRANEGKVGGTLSGDEAAPVRRGRLAESATGGRTSVGRGRSAGSVASVVDTDGGSVAGDVNATSERNTSKGHTTGGRNTTSDNNFDAANLGGINSGGKMGKQGTDRLLLPASPDWRRASTAGSFNLVVSVNAPVTPKDSSAKPAKKATAKSKGHAYIGLTGAPDISTVKMQSVKGVGTTWGLLLGYAFNSRWAIESGVSLDRKKYYTAGEYFDKSADAGLTGVQGTLNSVTGTCNMWEVPLNIRYNFNPGSKFNWFATAGVSSYFMTKQNYAYDLESSSGYLWNKSWGIYQAYNYWFSVINLSAGFEQHIGKIGNLRIEPYLRIPLSGIGTGKLPIMSAGLNIGITRQLW